MNLSSLNPEFVRNVRIHLRPGRIAVIAVICAVVSISAAAYALSTPLGMRPNTQDGRELLNLILTLQIVALLIGGGIYCLQSIHCEKDLNTFDFQRVTRLTPFELVLGKLFGAPVQMYFAFLCLMPIGIWSASIGRVPPSNFIMIYAVILLGSIAFHSMALLLSLVVERGTAAGGIIVFLILVWITSVDLGSPGSPVGLHALSPFFVYNLLGPDPSVTGRGANIFAELSQLPDTFFGAQVPHFWVLVLLFVTIASWFLLALARNIKRDPVAYELYSPVQGLAFSLYLNFLLLGFMRWSIPGYTFRRSAPAFITYQPTDPRTAEITFLVPSLFVLALFGLTLLRNRDRVRRRLRALGGRASGWWAALWPAPYLLAGSVLGGIAIVWMIQAKLHPQDAWNPEVGILEAAFFSAWVARDVLYLQWMSLRRGRRPILMAIIYMVVFYACASAIFVPLRWYTETRAPYASIFIPLYAYQLNPLNWVHQKGAWILALGLLGCEGMAFAALQWGTLQRVIGTPSQV